MKFCNLNAISGRMGFVLALWSSLLWGFSVASMIDEDTLLLYEVEPDSRTAQTFEKQGGDQEEATMFDKILPYPYEDYTLENGLRVLIYALGNEFPGLVNVQTYVDVGAREEVDEGKTGFAHFFEHMMFRGTPNVPEDDYKAVYEQMGGKMNAATGADYTYYYATFPAISAFGETNLDQVLYVEADRFKNINYTEAAFKTEAGAIEGEYHFRNDGEPWVAVRHLLLNLSYLVHTYKTPVLGELEDIIDMPNQYEYSKLFYDRYYNPENCVLIICGDVDVEETKTLVDRYYADWERGDNYQITVPQEPAPRGETLFGHIDDWEEPNPPILQLAFLATNFTLATPDAIALDFLLFGLFSSRSDIVQKVVDEEAAALYVGASYQFMKDPSLFTISSLVSDVDNVWYVRDEILKTLARARTTLFTEEELQETRSYLYYSTASNINSVEAVAGTVRFSMVMGDPEVTNDLYRAYETVTAEQVLEAANKYFTDDRLATIILTYQGDSLPEPPAPLAPEAHALAGSVDAVVDTLTQAPLDEDATPSTSEASPASSVSPVAPLTDDEYSPDQVLLQSKDSKLVDLTIRFRTGTVDDPDGKDGVAALVSAMLTDGGSASLTLDEINDIFYPMSASFSSITDKEHTDLVGRVHIDHLDQFYEVISESLLNPGFREEDFNRLLAERIARARQRAQDDGSLVARALDASIFEGHPYDRDAYGTVLSLESITLQDIRDFYATHYTKQNLILGLAGGFSDDFNSRILADLARNLPDGPVDKELLDGPPAKASSNAVIIQQPATVSTTISIGHSFPMDFLAPGHPDWAAMVIATRVIGSGFLSVLFQEVRNKRGINYANVARRRYGGLAFQYEMLAIENIEKAHFTSRLVLFYLDKLLVEGMDEDLFEQARTNRFNVLPLFVDTPTKNLGFAMDAVDLGYEGDFLTYAQEVLANVTLEDVNQACRKWLKTENVTFVFITPDAEELRTRLVEDETSTITYASDEVPEQVLADDILIQDFPLGLTEANIQIKTPGDLFPGYDKADVPLVDTTQTNSNSSNAVEGLDAMNGDDQSVDIAVTDDAPEPASDSEGANNTTQIPDVEEAIPTSGVGLLSGGSFHLCIIFVALVCLMLK